MGYKKDIISGFSWTFLLRITTRLIAFVKTIVLAKILIPSQFGAYGVALILLGFLEVMTETGVNVVLIQEKKIEKYLDSAWIISMARGLIISLIIILLTPSIAGFFKSPSSTQLLYLISAVPFLRGFINPSVVRFQKDLKFGSEFFYRFSILAVDAIVSITVSILTHSPVGIVLGLIVGVIVELTLSHVIVKPRPSLKIQKGYLGKIVHRGKWVTASGVFNYLFHNVDNIIVGKILGTGSLGVYQVAYSFSILPITEITDVVSKVTFPVFVKISDDKARLKYAFVKTVLFLVVLIIPFGAVLYLYPNEIISIVLGNRWVPAVQILPLLAIFGSVRAISGYASTLFLSVGKQEYVSVTTFISTLGIIIPIVPLVLQFGLLGAASSALIGSLVAVPFFLYYTLKILFATDEIR